MKNRPIDHRKCRPADLNIGSSTLGFTLIELAVTTAVIGIIVAIALPIYRDYTTRAGMAEMVLELDNMADRIKLFRQQNGRYPNDTHIVPPAEVPMPSYWSETTQLGGNYNWEGPNNYPYAGISILGATASDEHIKLFDKIVDDGDITTGIFRKTPNGRLTYIIDE